MTTTTNGSFVPTLTLVKTYNGKTHVWKFGKHSNGRYVGKNIITGRKVDTFGTSHYRMYLYIGFMMRKGWKTSNTVQLEMDLSKVK